MKIIVGLGNPGPEYHNTRHNMGFMVLEELAKRYPVEKQTDRFNAIIGEIRIKGEKILLVKPLTFMNLSGRAVQPLLHWYKVALTDLMVVYDDMDLKDATLRIRAKGSAGGHNGMKSIIERLGSQEFARMRVGIGRPERHDNINWVLGRFSAEEKPIMEAAIKKAADALETWVTSGINSAMNQYNG